MNITVDRAVIEQALEALERPTYDDFLEWASALKNARDALRAALEQPTRSQKMADAGFTPNDTRLTCDECGGQFTRQILPVHKCTALEQPQPVQVFPLEFTHMVIDKEDAVGKPIFWAEWPNREKA